MGGRRGNVPPHYPSPGLLLFDPELGHFSSKNDLQLVASSRFDAMHATATHAQSGLSYNDSLVHAGSYEPTLVIIFAGGAWGQVPGPTGGGTKAGSDELC